MKLDRYFYSTASGLFLVLMLVGFHAFYLHGTGFPDRQIDPRIFALDAVHGTAIALWFGLFFAQSLLIAARNRKLHMTLGWVSVVLGPAVAGLGIAVAITSVRITDPRFHFFGMLYSRFLLVMLAEMAMFAGFVAAGVLTRKKPRIHRNMMLMASLSILPGATGRTPPLLALFGTAGWMGLFGATFCIGLLLLLVRWAMMRRFDPWLAAGLAIWVAVFTGSMYLAMTPVWDRMAAVVLR
ncbi:MAG: hypothetical protein WBD67_04980 [Terracidiphilus sp.]